MRIIPIFLIMGKAGTKIIDCTKYSVHELDKIYDVYSKHEQYKIISTRIEV